MIDVQRNLMISVESNARVSSVGFVRLMPFFLMVVNYDVEYGVRELDLVEDSLVFWVG